MKKLLGTILALYCIMTASAQRIDYSEVDKDDYREMNFEIIGKVGGKISVYKNFKNRHDICVYDNEMQMTNRVKMDFLPERVINVDFIAYPEFAYMIYQHIFSSLFFFFSPRYRERKSLPPLCCLPAGSG